MFTKTGIPQAAYGVNWGLLALPPTGFIWRDFLNAVALGIDNYCPDASVQLGILGTTREARGKMILG